MKKLWPIVLGLVVVLAAAVLYLVREHRPVDVGGRIAPGPSPEIPAEGAGATQATPPSDPSREAPASEFGSLKVSIIGPSPKIAGLLLIIAEGNKQEATQRVATGKKESRADLRFPKIQAGAKRVVFLPESPHSSSTGEVAVRANSESELSLVLRDAATIRGVVVDSLLRPLKGATVEVSLGGVFPAVSKQVKPTTLFGGGRGSWGGVSGDIDRAYSTALRSYGFKSDGSVGLVTVTDADGRFSIAGLSEGSAEVSVTFELTSRAQVCAVGGESLIMLPIQKLTPEAKDEYEEVRRSLVDLLDKYAQSGGQDGAYLIQVKLTLGQVMEKSTLSKDRKEQLLRLLDEGAGNPK